MFKVRWATRSGSGRARGAAAAMVAGAALLASGCSADPGARAGATTGPGPSVAPTTVAPTTRPATVPTTTPNGAPASAGPVLPTGVYVGRFSAIDTARKRATLTVTGSDPECSGPTSGTYVVDLTNMGFVASGDNGMGQALDLTLGDWARDWANQTDWTVVNLPGHEAVTNGANAGCHP